MLVVPQIRRRKAEQLLMGAKVQAHWSGAPTADEIRARDGERLLADPILTEEPTPDEQALARSLLDGRSPEEVAAALVRMYRARLPEPEEIRTMAVGPAPRPAHVQADRPVRSPQAEGPGVWFGMPIGRRDKADPKWLVPLICRLGGVTKRDIGVIRILDEETRFEISTGMAERFAACIAATDDDEVRIAAAEAPPAGRPVRHSGAPARRGGPSGAGERRRTAPTLHSSRKRAS